VSSLDGANGPTGKQHDAGHAGGKLGARAASRDDFDGTLANPSLRCGSPLKEVSNPQDHCLQ